MMSFLKIRVQLPPYIREISNVSTDECSFNKSHNARFVDNYAFLGFVDGWTPNGGEHEMQLNQLTTGEKNEQ
ncbi:MAG: hypothetical protein COB78_03120 [Hyphomicrobiales bacterium]|nr:MAG: hypothetical protein COB78_03120 [Hyphomicrobiales bacterium]